MSVSGGLHWEAFGQPGAEPLILSAGLGGSGSYWQPNIAALARDYRVIVYDHRGTGRSDRTLDGPVSVDTMADDIIGLMDALGIEKAHFVGHAAGGVAGLALALKAPQRLCRLVVVNGWSKLDPHFARCFDIRLEILRNGGPRAYLRAQPLFLYPAEWISRHLGHIDDEIEAQLASFQGPENLSKRIAALRLFNIDARLGEIGVPTLALAAEDDMLVPASCSQRIATGIRGARLTLLPKGGHACNVTVPERFDDIVLRWLKAFD
ncbi:pyrimidine utilization protein D [Sphingomonas montanisoli]|uniref:Putative carbamate hydrolase RutD n=1 Tax=Sphingomonas montanisoli TaxID=2606412 RepID=A0A5D9C808_9SPHN|nr:pyrimidine utilization protein D [Sphingomonas montanisoli]TZG27543.1 pyrimidine utilization protein D [Sphingomonas montanisoli]